MWQTRALFRSVGKQSARPGGFAAAADAWLNSHAGRWCRVGLLSATVVGYPVYQLIVSGPLVGYAFKRRVAVEELPPHLQKLVEEEHKAWLERMGRKERDAYIEFYSQANMTDVDSVYAGSLGIRSGARVALPCFARLADADEARNFCAERLEPLNLRDTTTCIVWNSPFGRELMQTMLLSTKALRFLIARDIESMDGYQAFVNKALSWATFHTFSSLLIYGLHRRRRAPTALAFVVLYSFFTLCASYGALEWHKLYRYMNDVHADNAAARVSADHCAGGIEYYVKLLRRNHVMEKSRLFSAAGDVNAAPTPYFTRFTLVKDVTQEFSEFGPIKEGDVF